MLTILCLPKKFISYSRSLQSLGVNNVAWHYSDIFNVIEHLAQHNFVILGGDVYRINDGLLEPTYDSWYIEKNTIPANKNLVTAAQEKAVAYIRNYHQRNGVQYLYSLVIEKLIS